MRPSEKIENLVEKMNFTASAELRKQILDDAIKAHEQTKTQPAFEKLNIWRIIMKSRIAKLSTAATIVLTVVLLVTFLNQTTTHAWAIEETIKALEKFDSLYVSGVFLDEKGVMSNFELWAKPHSKDNTRSGDFRIDIKDKEIAVAIEDANITYRYYPQSNTVNVLKGLQNSIKPFWPGSDFFRELKGNAMEWQETYGQEEQGKECVFVTCTYTLDRLPGAKFEFWFQFDIKTKLPVRMKIKDFSTTRGMEQYNMDKIICNPELTKEIFKFDIPDGAKVVQQ